MESVLMEETSPEDSVLERFKAKVNEAADLAKLISLEHQMAAWKFWSDISLTIKSLTGAKSVSIQADLLDENKQWEYKALVPVAQKDDNACHESFHTVDDPLEDNHEDFSRVISKAADDLANEALNISVANSNTNNEFEIAQSPNLKDSQSKPKRGRGRPRKNPKKPKTSIQEHTPEELNESQILQKPSELSNSPSITFTDTIKVLDSMVANEVKREKPDVCQVCGQIVGAPVENGDTCPEMGKRCSECGGVLPKRRRTPKKSSKSKDMALFLCSICQETFIDKEALDSHLQLAHSDQEDSVGKIEEVHIADLTDPEWKSSPRKQRSTRRKKIKVDESAGEENENLDENTPQKGQTTANTTCHICNAKLSHETALIVHMRTHTGERPFSCKICGLTFTTNGNMARHEQTHSGAKPHPCEICGKHFTEKKSVKVHMRSHTGEKPYKCTVCGRGFSQTGMLRTHMDLHLGRKGHLCDCCGKPFRTKGQLRVHQKRHFNNRDFKCDKCKFTFVTKSDLERHVLKHTGERPFLCTLCPRSFTRMQYLREHVNTHTGNKPYSCKLCEHTFHDMSSYHRHLRKHKAKEVNAQNNLSAILTDEELQTEEMATVLIPTGSNLEALSMGQNSELPMTHSILTQNAAGEYELTYIDQSFLTNEFGAGELSESASADGTDGRSVTLVVSQDDQVESEKQNVTFFLSPEGVKRIQQGMPPLDEGEQPVEGDVTQILESYPDAQIVTSESDPNTYHVTFMDSTSMAQTHVFTELDNTQEME